MNFNLFLFLVCFIFFIAILVFLYLLKYKIFNNENIKIIEIDVPMQALVIKNNRIINVINEYPKTITNQIACNGNIINKILHFSKLNPKLNIIIPFTDEDPFYENPYQLFYNNDSKKLIENYNKIMNIFDNKNIIFFISCFYNLKPSFYNIYRIPWTDIIYDSLPEIINNNPLLSKIKKVVWRGVQSGGSNDSLRIRIINKLKNNNYCNVEFLNSWNSLTPLQQSQYRAILMIDGNSWPSSIIWNFLSGSIIISVSVWYTIIFDKFEPWIDYIPCSPDLSNLNYIIDYIMDDNNILELQKIVENGKRKFLKYFNSNLADFVIREAILNN